MSRPLTEHANARNSGQQYRVAQNSDHCPLWSHTYYKITYMYVFSWPHSLYIERSDVTVICGHITIAMLWGNTAYCVKLIGEYLSCYSNKIDSVDVRKFPQYCYLTEKVMSQYHRVCVSVGRFVCPLAYLNKKASIRRQDSAPPISISVSVHLARASVFAARRSYASAVL